MVREAMAATARRPAQSGLVKTFDSLNPATEEPVGTFPVFGEDDVNETVARAREAAAWWSALGWKERQTKLLAWKSYLTRYIMRLAEVVHAETGKPTADAQLEIMLAIVHIDWAAKHARKVLGQHKVRSGLVAFNHASTVQYHPLGVVGVIGPWNYPVFTPIGSIAYALAAGNTVVFKPSEYTPGVGVWLADTFAEVVPEHPVLSVVTGSGETGAALCRSGVDKIALIVDEDADVAAAAEAAVWGAMANAGQSCAGVERVYVVDSLADEFVGLATDRARTLRVGAHPGADIGPMTVPSQVDVVRSHIADAMARGGQAVVGGLDSVRSPYVEPVVLVDVPQDSIAVTDETFGPTLVINRVRNADEAVELANASRYALGASVFEKARGPELAAKLRAGMVSVNSVLSYAAVPALPFGGSGESGFGRIHGEDGLREFTRAQSVTRQRFRPLLRAMTFVRGGRTVRKLLRLVRLRYGR